MEKKGRIRGLDRHNPLYKTKGGVVGGMGVGAGGGGLEELLWSYLWRFVGHITLPC